MQATQMLTMPVEKNAAALIKSIFEGYYIPPLLFNTHKKDGRFIRVRFTLQPYSFDYVAH
jgi:hypothetical protein